MDIVELLSSEPNGLSLTEIGSRLELNKTTVFRLLSVLRERGYIEKNETSNLYRVGPGFIEVASLYLNRIEIKTEAAPYLNELSRQVNETVFLATLQGAEVVYLEKFEQFNTLRKYSIIGQRKPIYCTSLGKAILFDKSDEEIRELLGSVTLEPFTPNTVSSVDQLIANVREARARGYSSDDEEEEVGIRCAGAPVFDYRGNVIAAISISWYVRPPSHGFEEMGAAVVETADKISQRLGFVEKRGDNARRRLTEEELRAQAAGRA